MSEFNTEITSRLLEGAIKRLQALSSKEAHIVRVPGAIEIPLMAQHLARSKHYDAIVALGAVIRGETTHYDYVCQQVSNGCQKVSLEHHLPVIFGILTTENELQALERTGGRQGHKGQEAIDAAFQMIHLLRQPTE
jgi:6,7-dimethyl-8-ribityllumazine synthase